MFEEQGPDDMKSEFPSHIEECFYSSLEGAYFKREMTKARDDKRIGLPVPYDPSRLVNTFWDIGMDDENCIWFHQTDGVRHRLIDFYKNTDEVLPRNDLRYVIKGLVRFLQILLPKDGGPLSHAKVIR
jgi:hypothetical protein